MNPIRIDVYHHSCPPGENNPGEANDVLREIQTAAQATQANSLQALDALQRITLTLQGVANQMADIITDETRLEADVQAETALIQQVKAQTDANAQALADANAEINTLKSQGVDTTRIEAALTTLEANNAALSGIAAPAQPTPPAPTNPAPTPSGDGSTPAPAGVPTPAQTPSA